MITFHLQLILALCLTAALWEPSPATVVETATKVGSVSTLPTSSGRFLFWETCEDQWNEEKKRTEKCCKGNYKCSDKLCEGNKLCKFAFGFMKNTLWCHVQKCKEIEGDKDDGKDKDKDKDEDEDKDENKDENKDEDKDEEDGNGKGKDKGKGKGKGKGKDKGNGKGKGKGKDKDSKGKDKSAKDKEDEPMPSVEIDLKDSDNDSGIDQGEGNKGNDSAPAPTASPSPSPQSNDPLHCSGTRNRREIRDMTTQQRLEWQEAILALRADRDTNGDSEWDRLVRLHIRFGDEAHGGAYFLPWHRLFLLRVENALRKINPSIAIPYWDWTQDAEDAARSPVWGAGYVGGAQRGNRPIQTGPFANIDAKYPVAHIVRRNFTSGTSREMPLLWGRDHLERLINEPLWMDFTDGIETAHALPHIYIGGDMGNAHHAPNDPVFHIHHAFVDSLWQIRQKQGDRSQFSGTHAFNDGARDASSTHIFDAFDVPASAAIDLSCVNYILPNRRGRSISGRSTRGTPDMNICENHDNLIKNRERCRNGVHILEREAKAPPAEEGP